MADVQVGDVLKITSGPRNGDKFHVRGIIDVRGELSGITATSWLDSECTIERPNETVNAFGESDPGTPTVVATAVKCSIQLRGMATNLDVRERGWGQEETFEPTVYFDDRTVSVDLTEEAKV